MRETCVLNFGSKICKAPDGLLLFADDVQPAEPFAFIFPGPKQGILSPKPPDLVVNVPIIERRFDRRGQLSRQEQILQVDVAVDDGLLRVRSRVLNAL